MSESNENSLINCLLICHYNCAFDEPVKNYISGFVRIPFAADMEFMNHLNLPVFMGVMSIGGVLAYFYAT